MSQKANIEKAIDPRIIRIRMINGVRITGQVNIKRYPGYDRLSEIVAGDMEPFLVIINATVNEKDFDKPVRIKTLILNKSHILWAEPEEDEK